MAAKRYWEVATIRRFAIYVNNWETFGTEGQWPLSGGGRYTEVAAIRGSTVFTQLLHFTGLDNYLNCATSLEQSHLVRI